MFDQDKAETTKIKDTYILVDGRRDNIKIRKDTLQYKQFIESFEGVEVYRPKRTLTFPIGGGEIAEIFPRAQGSSDAVVKSTRELNSLLERFSYSSIWFTVQKERHRRLLGETTLEFTTVRAEDSYCWSLCVQHPSFEKVAYFARRFPMDNARVTGYADFLRHVAGAP
jgi:hypothetical protein